MQTLPEFFCGRFPHKNPETYMNYRNYIIKMYRECPTHYLSATECRKKLPGDICGIIRLHAFLEHWGLINFNVEQSLRPARLVLGESGSISQEVIDSATKGFINLAEAKKIAKGGEDASPQSNLMLIASTKMKALSTTYSPVCNFCGNVCEANQWFKKIPPKDSFLNET